MAWTCDDDDWCFTASFVHMVGEMGWATSKGNEAKSKMKQLSDAEDWTQVVVICDRTRYQSPPPFIYRNVISYYKFTELYKNSSNVFIFEAITDCNVQQTKSS